MGRITNALASHALLGQPVRILECPGRRPSSQYSTLLCLYTWQRLYNCHLNSKTILIFAIKLPYPSFRASMVTSVDAPYEWTRSWLREP